MSEPSKRRIGECDRHDAEDMGLGSSARCTCSTTATIPVAGYGDERHRHELAEAEIRGQMRHITAEIVRGDQPLEAKEELIADLRARLSHVEAERDDALARLARLATPARRETETDPTPEEQP